MQPTVFYTFYNVIESLSLSEYIAKTVHFLFYYHLSIQKNPSFNTLKITANKDLKNPYIISNKTSINKDKNTYKENVCNQQEVN